MVFSSIKFEQLTINSLLSDRNWAITCINGPPNSNKIVVHYQTDGSFTMRHLFFSCCSCNKGVFYIERGDKAITVEYDMPLGDCGFHCKVYDIIRDIEIPFVDGDTSIVHLFSCIPK